MATVLADFAEIKNLVMDHTKTSGSWGSYDQNPNYENGLIETEIRKANDDLVNAICANPNHSRRGDYTIETALNFIAGSGEQLPSSIGGWQNLKIKRSDNVEVRAKKADFSWIEQINNSVDLDGEPEDFEGYYMIDAPYVYFTGESMGLTYCDPAKASGTTLTAPHEYTQIIRDLTLCRLYMKHEDKPASAQFYMSLALAILKAVTNDSEDVPSL